MGHRHGFQGMGLEAQTVLFLHPREIGDNPHRNRIDPHCCRNDVLLQQMQALQYCHSLEGPEGLWPYFGIDNPSRFVDTDVASQLILFEGTHLCD